MSHSDWVTKFGSLILIDNKQLNLLKLDWIKCTGYFSLKISIFYTNWQMFIFRSVWAISYYWFLLTCLWWPRTVIVKFKNKNWKKKKNKNKNENENKIKTKMNTKTKIKNNKNKNKNENESKNENDFSFLFSFWFSFLFLLSKSFCIFGNSLRPKLP